MAILMSYQIGDRVRCIKDADRVKVGMKGTVVVYSYTSVGVEWETNIGGHDCSMGGGIPKAKDKYGWFVSEDYLEIINRASSTKGGAKIMSKLKTIFKTLVDPEVQVLREAGFLNGDLELRDEGRDALLDILFLEKKPELVALAKEKLAQEKEEKKNG